MNFSQAVRSAFIDNYSTLKEYLDKEKIMKMHFKPSEKEVLQALSHLNECPVDLNTAYT